METINVTNAHLCHRCPRLMAYQVSGKNKAWTVGLKGGGNFPGKIFHDLVAQQFHTRMCQGPKNDTYLAVDLLMQKKDRDLNTGLYAILDKHILEPLLESKASEMKGDQITALATGINHWSRTMAQFLSRTRDRRKKVDLSVIFCPPEKQISSELLLPGGQTIKLVGIYDGLLMDTEARDVVIVEFKGLKAANPDEDLIQVGLYAMLLKRAIGLTPQGMVLYLEEEDPLATYSSEILERLEPNLLYLVEEAVKIKGLAKQKGKVKLIPPSNPSLCGIWNCPFKDTCDKDWGPRQDKTVSAQTEVKTRPVVENKTQEKTKKSTETQTQSNEEAEQLLKTLVDTLIAIKLPVEPEGYILGPRLVRLKIRPLIEKGATVSKITNRAGDLQIALSTRVAPLIQTAAGHMTVDVPRKITTPLTLGEVWERGKKNNPNLSAAFPLGMAVDGSIFWAKLSEPTMTSMLVAGTAGSGKSIFLRSAILGLARNAGPEYIRFTLIDPKLVSFTDFSDLPHLHQPIIYELEPAMNALKSLVDEMENRYQTFAGARVFDIGDYRRQGHNLAHHVVIIDEYADLMIEKKLKQEAEILIQRLCQKGRAAGFHVILSTQRPDVKVVTSLIKANLQLKVALKVTNSSNSQVILDASGAENLMGNGDMLVGGAIPLTRLQGPLATKTDLDLVVKKWGI